MLNHPELVWQIEIVVVLVYKCAGTDKFWCVRSANQNVARFGRHSCKWNVCFDNYFIFGWLEYTFSYRTDLENCRFIAD